MKSFAALIDYARKRNADLDQVVAKVLLDLSSSVIRKTPVDDGTLRRNWNASLNAPDTSTTTATDKAGASTIAAAARITSQASGKVYYLVNSLPYARRIEYEGHSRTKAPQGMLRVSIREFDAHLKRQLSAVR